MRRCTICFFINLFLCFYCKSQKLFTPLSPDTTAISFDSSHSSNLSLKSHGIQLNERRFNNTLLKTVPSTFYFNSIGFFCQKELQVEKAMRHSVKFRLGSVEYTDKIEGKR